MLVFENHTLISKKDFISKSTDKLAILSGNNKIRSPAGCHVLFEEALIHSGRWHILICKMNQYGQGIKKVLDILGNYNFLMESKLRVS